MFSYSGLNRIPTLSARALAGLDMEAQFLPQCSAEKSAYAVGLPFGGGHEFLQRGAFAPLQQFQDCGRLTALAGLTRPRKSKLQIAASFHAIYNKSEKFGHVLTRLSIV
jgi:hypothetical protein